MTMSGDGARKFDLPEDLFGDSEPPPPDEQPKPPLRRSSRPPSFEDMTGKCQARMDKRKSTPKVMAAATFDRALREIDDMIETGDWSDLSARHLVALFDRMHEKCYGFPAAELGPQERYIAVVQAGSLVRREFAGDYEEAMEFMRWFWDKEIGAEKWRRDNGRDGRRVGARLMFSGRLVDDYRLHVARRHQRG